MFYAAYIFHLFCVALYFALLMPPYYAADATILPYSAHAALRRLFTRHVAYIISYGAFTMMPPFRHAADAASAFAPL